MRMTSINELEAGIIQRYPMKLPWQLFNTLYGLLTLFIELVRRFFSRVIIFWIKKDPYSTEVLPLILEGHRYSYLGIGSEGIIFRFWPLYIVKCTWDRVKLDKVKRKIVLDPTDLKGVHYFGSSVNQISLPISAFSKLKLDDIADENNQS